MHDVGLVLEQVVDALDDIPLSEHDLVPHWHELVLHVAAQSVHQVYSPVEEALEEPGADVPPVGEHLSVQVPGEDGPHPLVPVVHACPCEAERYDLPAVVAEDVQLEAVAPAHRALSVVGQPVEHLVEVPADVMADGNHGGIHEADARAVAEAPQVQEHHQGEEHPRHEFDKAVVRYGIGEIGLHVDLDEMHVVMLEVAECAKMVAHHDGHDLALGEPALAVPCTLLCGNWGGQREVLAQFLVKILCEFVDNTENFRNFVSGNHGLNSCLILYK